MQKRYPRVRDVRVSEADIQKRLSEVIERCNALPGPAVEWDAERGCYGLRARQPYKAGQRITRYGGRKSVAEVQGDYVARCSEVHVDGRVDFLLSEKGRWINESDRNRTRVNVALGREVRAVCDIQEGEWLFADYGDEYERHY